jgi:sporulation protein YlmC with PRC-barrel domain
MSDYGRYSSDNRTMNRDRDFDPGRERNRGSSIFGGGGRGGDWRSSDRSRDPDRFRDQDRFRERDEERSNRFGGSDYDRDQRGEKSFGRDDHREGLPVDETGRLIASNKVEGTAVYGRDGERLGSIYNFMVDKFSGRVEYAVMTYGGFLGMGTRYYPLPWRVLSYDTRAGGYRIHLCERDLRDAPSFDRNSEPRFDRDYGERVHGWYGLNY